MKAYERIVLAHPIAWLVAVALLLGTLATGLPDFRIEASSDSLLLESDESLEYYRSIRARYGSDDFLVLTYTPQQDLFSEQVLADLRELRDAVAAIEQVDSVVSILDVPLFESTPQQEREAGRGRPTLLDPRTDVQAARKELRTSPLYRNRLLSEDVTTTAMQINLRRDKAFQTLLDERAALREKRLENELATGDLERLESLAGDIREHRRERQTTTAHTISRIRELMQQHSARAQMHLSGLPMINVDILRFIEHDLRVFGTALFVMLVVLLGIIFRAARWIVLPLLVCSATILGMAGILGHVEWAVTVVSSNFVSLLLILVLSLNVHLAVRYRELDVARKQATQRELVSETVRTKFLPALLTAISTMAAFASLVVADIRPVIDFGLMMCAGLALGFVLTFLVLPPALVLLDREGRSRDRSVAARITSALGQLIKARPWATLAVYAVLAIASAWGISRLSLDNRFIDYFDESTEIHQGMTIIDRELGGTTPLEVILDGEQEQDRPQEGLPEAFRLTGDPGFATKSYWYGAGRLDNIRQAHEFLERQEEIGSVMSLHSTIQVLRTVAGDREFDNFNMSVIYERLSADVKETLFRPYLSKDGDQLRFATRVHETGPAFDRERLLTSVREFFVSDMGIAAERVHLTGLFVLYNNVLQSLLRSQLMTVAVVFVAVLGMFAIAFRSLRVAAIAIVPNMLGAAIVLAFMGLVGMPLDIMTITIAAIAIGIGVDDTIHYVHRLRDEYRESGDYSRAIERSQDSVGRAMYYTTLVIVIGFSLLAFSKFVPTVYFGLLTGLAMAIALVANLTLLPLLLMKLGAFAR